MATTANEGEDKGKNELFYSEELRLGRRMRESGIVLTQPRGSSFICAAEAEAEADADAEVEADADADADGGEATGQQNKRYTNTEAYARFSAITDFSQFLDRLKADVAADDTVCVNQSMRFYDIPLQLQLWVSPVMDVQIKWNTYVRAVR